MRRQVRAAGVAEVSGVIQVSMRTRKWRVCREAQAEMGPPSRLQTGSSKLPQYFKSSTGGCCGISAHLTVQER